MKIYVITQGEYSDYHIVGVAIDKEKAKRIAEVNSDSWYEATINEYDTDSFDEVIENGRMYHVTKHATGKIRASIVEKWQLKDLEEDEIGKVTRERGTYWGGETYNDLDILIRAKNVDHAIKIASEKFAEYEYREAVGEL